MSILVEFHGNLLITYTINLFKEEGFSQKMSTSSHLPKIYKHVTPSQRNMSIQKAANQWNIRAPSIHSKHRKGIELHTCFRPVASNNGKIEGEQCVQNKRREAILLLPREALLANMKSKIESVWNRISRLKCLWSEICFCLVLKLSNTRFQSLRRLGLKETILQALKVEPFCPQKWYLNCTVKIPRDTNLWRHFDA